MAYWPDTGTGVDTQPARKPVQSALRKYFTEGGIGQAPTVPGGDWFNQMTNEVLNVLEAAGIEPSKTDDDQLLQAILLVSKAMSAREALRRTYAQAGYNLRPEPESFKNGGILTSAVDVLLDEASGNAYSGTGPFPQTVDADTDPSTGGFTSRHTDIPRNYASIERMVADNGLVAGNIVSTGGSRWEIVHTTTPMPLQNGLYAELIGDLFVGDFAADQIAQINAYITAGISESYATRALAESYKYSMAPVTVVFNAKITSAAPLLLMHHVKYQRVGPGMYFNRAMQSGMHYAPFVFDSCATEPVVFELSGGAFVRKTGVLIGTPDNPVGGDSDYITMSDGCDVSFDVTTATGVKVGFNFACCPGITGDRPSMGVAEQAGDAISVPKVAMLLCKSWTHSIYKPMLRSSQQSVVISGANAGGIVDQPYCQRDGTLVSDLVPYTTAGIIAAGKAGSAGITFLGTRDATVEQPVVENFKYPFVSSDSESLIKKPHIEGVNVENSFVVENAYLDVDNWATVWPTATGPLVYSVEQDGADRMVLLRGMPMTLGPINGLVGGIYNRAFLIIEDASGAVTDYAKMGDWAAVRRFDLSLVRSIFVDAVAGDDANMGLTNSRPVKTISTAIKILNAINRMSPALGLTDISLKSNVTIDTVTRAYKSFALWGAYTLTSQAAAYIELYGCNVQLRQPTINAASAAVIRHVGGNVEVLCDSTVVSGVAICQTSGPGSIHMNVKNGDTTGISKYVDGSGATAVSLIVNSATRNTAIDSSPVGSNQLLLGSKFTN